MIVDHDHVLRVAEHLHTVDALLDRALNANVAQMAMRQNESRPALSDSSLVVVGDAREAP